MRRVAASIVAIGLCSVTPALAQPAAPDDPSPPLSVLPTRDDLMDPAMTRSWGAGPPRGFVSSAVDAGWIYLRPRVSLGYGRPFTSWIGLDANPVVQSAGIGAYGGVRFALPWVDLRLGSRYFFSFQRTYLEPRDTYTRVELDEDIGRQASTVTHEAELTFDIPAGPGKVLLLGSGSIVTGVPAGKYVFEETLRAIVAPPILWRARTGYLFSLGGSRQHSVGLVVEMLDSPKRDDAYTFRAGPILRFAFSRRVELRGSFVMTVKSPDQLGLIGGDFTELGVRYRWATE